MDSEIQLRDEGEKQQAIEELQRKYPLAPADSAILEDFFTYHQPTGDQALRYTLINEAAKAFAEVVMRYSSFLPDRMAALRLIREARMTANAGVALGKLAPPSPK